MLKAWEMSKIVRHEASAYSPFPMKWEASGGEWLCRVLEKTMNPKCGLMIATAVKRTGSGDRSALKTPSIIRDPTPVMLKKPAQKRPASSSHYTRFESVRARKTARVQFKE